ncbi:hypothetical protein POM88_049144 [Heracleum sosnowskyi]|uniref:NADH:ubiquinone oxidoreductase 30kDa subunit domain-containing protein n=1 Tax=Heracleum sosnowskyi TaxID=360622 RepID=A0AAD8GXQ1_9APIA|nr:hypothetical protein POM88_049144 [Heracleum sosnowskyi]
MFGVSSINHPDLRRISTYYGFEGHPLFSESPAGPPTTSLRPEGRGSVIPNSPILFQIPVTIRLNERDDRQMIARLNKFEILDQMSEHGKHVLPKSRPQGEIKVRAEEGIALKQKNHLKSHLHPDSASFKLANELSEPTTDRPGTLTHFKL